MVPSQHDCHTGSNFGSRRGRNDIRSKPLRRLDDGWAKEFLVCILASSAHALMCRRLEGLRIVNAAAMVALLCREIPPQQEAAEEKQYGTIGGLSPSHYGKAIGVQVFKYSGIRGF
jgi:hypothetical protein